MIHIRKKKTIDTIFWHLEFCIGHYTLEITDGQSWSNYIGPKRDISQVCLTRPVFTHFSLKVAWSGIYLIVRILYSTICQSSLRVWGGGWGGTSTRVHLRHSGVALGLMSSPQWRISSSFFFHFFSFFFFFLGGGGLV